MEIYHKLHDERQLLQILGSGEKYDPSPFCYKSRPVLWNKTYFRRWWCIFKLTPNLCLDYPAADIIKLMISSTHIMLRLSLFSYLKPCYIKVYDDFRMFISLSLLYPSSTIKRNVLFIWSRIFPRCVHLSCDRTHKTVLSVGCIQSAVRKQTTLKNFPRILPLWAKECARNI